MKNKAPILTAKASAYIDTEVQFVKQQAHLVCNIWKKLMLRIQAIHSEEMTKFHPIRYHPTGSLQLTQFANFRNKRPKTGTLKVTTVTAHNHAKSRLS